MTIKEFAKYCDVSPATISRYFNDTNLVSEKARKLIEKAISETNYKPKEVLKSSKTNDTVILLLPDWHHEFLHEISYALQAEFEAHDKTLISLSCENLTTSETLKIIQTINPIGIVFLDLPKDIDLVPTLVEKKIPIIMCTEPSPFNELPTVRVDDIAASYDGIKYLINLGHKRIGILTNIPFGLNSLSMRVMAYEKCLRDHKIPFYNEDVIYAGNSFQNGYECARALINSRPDLTAIFAFSDSMASGALSAAQDLGLKVPEDISIMGFDGCALSDQTRPKLTTVAQPIQDLAKHTVELLLSKKCMSTILNHSIKTGGSCMKID